MTQLLVLVVMALAGLMCWRWSKYRYDANQRKNPPERVRFEVVLPPDIADSEVRMADVWKALTSATKTDARSRKSGGGVIELIYHGIGVADSANEVRVFIGCDKDEEARVRRTLRNKYPVQFPHFDGDPLARAHEDCFPRPVPASTLSDSAE